MKVLIVTTAITMAAMVLTAAQAPTVDQAPADQELPALEFEPRPPFPEGARFAYVDIQRVAAESDDGLAANASAQALSEEKLVEIETMNTDLQTKQLQFQQGQTVLSPEASLDLQNEIERLQLEVQRFSQDAETEVQALQQSLQIDFQRKLVPIIQEVASGRQLQFIFSAGDSGLLWADAALDVTEEVILLLNEAGGEPPLN